MAIQVLIVDDHPVFREGLRSLLENQIDMTVCGEAADCDAVLKHLSRMTPDIITLDLSLGEGITVD